MGDSLGTIPGRTTEDTTSILKIEECNDLYQDQRRRDSALHANSERKRTVSMSLNSKYISDATREKNLLLLKKKSIRLLVELKNNFEIETR